MLANGNHKWGHQQGAIVRGGKKIGQRQEGNLPSVDKLVPVSKKNGTTNMFGEEVQLEFFSYQILWASCQCFFVHKKARRLCHVPHDSQTRLHGCNLPCIACHHNETYSKVKLEQQRIDLVSGYKAVRAILVQVIPNIRHVQTWLMSIVCWCWQIYSSHLTSVCNTGL